MTKQILAITTCRVSTPEQEENNSLNRQAIAVKQAAEELGAIIPNDGQWSGSVSSKVGSNIHRKDLKEMIAYCKKNPRVKYLIVHEVDRFMRSIKELFYFEVEFEKLGVKVWYASQSELNTDDYKSKLFKALEAFKGESSNVERITKSIAGQTDALRSGRYPFAPKAGYKKGTETGIQEVDGSRGAVLKETLVSVASGLKTPPQALKELNESIFMKGRALYKMDKFRKILTDPFYAGIVEINKQVIYRNENGLHEPLITKIQHEELVRIMHSKKKNQSGPRKNGNPKYQLSNQVSCANCIESSKGRFVGLDLTNGRNKAVVYEKYRCRSCKKYVNREEMHSMVKKQFDDNQLSDNGKKALIKALGVVWKQNEESSAQEAVRLKHKIKTIKTVVENHVEAATDPSNALIKQDILDSIKKKRLEVEELEDRVSSLTDKDFSDKERFMKFALGFADDMGKVFFEISKENRLRCKLLIFPGGFYVDSKNKVYTTKISPLIRLASIKKDLPITEKSLLVRVKRL
jgi:DNA invertase Pin-like site-specific DNA recombinase